MKTVFTVSSDHPRIQMNMGGLVRFTSMDHIIKQAARNGQRRSDTHV